MDIRERVIKLLEVAKSDNEHEASLAMAMAQTLMDKHRISMAELCVEDEDAIIQDENPLAFAGRVYHWKAFLMDTLARANGCILVKETHLGEDRGGKRGTRLTLFGRPSDIATSRLLIEYALKQLSKFAPGGVGNTNRRKSWYLGAVQGVAQKVHEAKLRVAREAPQFALITVDQCNKVDDFINETQPETQTGTPTEYRIDPVAFREGYARGHALPVNSEEPISV